MAILEDGVTGHDVVSSFVCALPKLAASEVGGRGETRGKEWDRLEVYGHVLTALSSNFPVRFAIAAFAT